MLLDELDYSWTFFISVNHHLDRFAVIKVFSSVGKLDYKLRQSGLNSQWGKTKLNSVLNPYQVLNRRTFWLWHFRINFAAFFQTCTQDDVLRRCVLWLFLLQYCLENQTPQFRQTHAHMYLFKLYRQWTLLFSDYQVNCVLLVLVPFLENVLILFLGCQAGW